MAKTIFTILAIVAAVAVVLLAAFLTLVSYIVNKIAKEENRTDF